MATPAGPDLPIAAVQTAQVVTILLAAPGVSGVISRVEARLQGRRGPRVLQPYYDLAKLFAKESLAPAHASGFFLAAPLLALACYLTVPLLIPVLTTFPLPLGYMGDILGGGFILSLAGFAVAVAAAESGGPYAQLGSSRAKTFSRDHRAGRAVRGAHGRAGHHHRPALCDGRHACVRRSARSSARRICSPRPRCSW